MSNSDTPSIDKITASVEIVDDRITMSAHTGTTLYLETPDRVPLEERDTHLTLRAQNHNEDVSIELDFDGMALDRLGYALEQVQESME